MEEVNPESPPKCQKVRLSLTELENWLDTAGTLPDRRCWVTSFIEILPQYDPVSFFLLFRLAFDDSMTTTNFRYVSSAEALKRHLVAFRKRLMSLVARC